MSEQQVLGPRPQRGGAVTVKGHVPIEPSPVSKLLLSRSFPNASFGPYARLSMVCSYEVKCNDVVGVH